MYLLFDQNISFRILPKISHALPKANYIKNLGLENATDFKIWNFSKSNHYTIFTLDSDFIYFSNLFGPPPKVICLQTGNQTTADLAKYLFAKSKIIKAFLEAASKDAALLLCRGFKSSRNIEKKNSGRGTPKK